jgi:hypothetical protein
LCVEYPVPVLDIACSLGIGCVFLA